jgi:hypothetical protein
MQKEIKTLDGIMSLDESNDVIGHMHHKEARNGVFKGNVPNMAFTAIRGNLKITNSNLQTTACRMEGIAVYVPDCTIDGNAQIYTPACNLVGDTTLRYCDLTGTSILISLLPNWVLQPYNTCSSCHTYTVKVDMNPDSPTYHHYQINDVYAGEAAPPPGDCNPSQQLVNTIYSTCFSCIPTIIKRDENLCSSTYHHYFISGEDQGATLPAIDACVTAADWTLQSFKTCISCTDTDVYKDLNFCSSTWNHYKVNNIDIGDISPTPGSCNPNEILSLTGYTTCMSCMNKPVSIDTNPCSLTYNQYKANGVFLGTTEPSRLNCVTTKSLIATGNSTCYIDCTSTPVTRDENLCSSTYHHYFVLAEDQGVIEPSSASCVTTPDWVLQTFQTCDACQTYDVYRDMTFCSPSYNKYKYNDIIRTTVSPTPGACYTGLTLQDQGYTSCYQCQNRPVTKNINPCSPYANYYYIDGVIQTLTPPPTGLCTTGVSLVGQGEYTCYGCETLEITKNMNPCSTTYLHYYVKTEDQGLTKPPVGNCDVTPNWVLQSFQTCDACNTYDVYKDTNVCSPSGLKYKYNNIIRTTTPPTAGACYTGISLVDKGYTTCYSCQNKPVSRNENPCSPTYLHYYVNGIDQGLTAPSSGLCVTSVSLVSQGYTTCFGCTTYTVTKNMNPCSTTYLHYYVNSEDQGLTAPTSGTCDTSQIWVNSGSFSCYGTCNKYNIETQSNVCGAAYGTTRQGSLVATNTTYCGGCCGLSTVPVWTNTGVSVCISCVSYLEQRDTNTCSSSYNSYITTLRGGTACSTTPVWADNYTFCSGLDLYMSQNNTNPCSSPSTRSILVETNSASCGAVVYILSNCNGSGTGYSVVYGGGFSIGQVVYAGGSTWTITGTTTASSAGSYTLTASGLGSCPVYTIFYDNCTGYTYYMSASGYSGLGYSSDTGTCLSVTTTSSTPSGTQIYNWYSDSGCLCV